MAVLLLPLGCVVRSRAMPLAGGAHTYGVCSPVPESSLPGVVLLWLVGYFILAEDANARVRSPGIGGIGYERQVWLIATAEAVPRCGSLLEGI
jgi:hypothetical protein